MELSDEEQYEVSKREMTEYLVSREAFRAERRALAEVAVTKALRSYRWWGWTNIVNTIRVAVASWRFKREQAKRQA